MYYQCILTERSTQFQLDSARYSPHANTDQGVLDVQGKGSQGLEVWAPGLLMLAVFNTKSKAQLIVIIPNVKKLKFLHI